LKPVAADWRKEKKAVTFFDDVTVYLFDQVSVPFRVLTAHADRECGLAIVLSFEAAATD
jgi:tyrosine kinase 2